MADVSVQVCTASERTERQELTPKNPDPSAVDVKRRGRG
jgi:hypothetical protein